MIVVLELWIHKNRDTYKRAIDQIKVRLTLRNQFLFFINNYKKELTKKDRIKA